VPVVRDEEAGTFQWGKQVASHLGGTRPSRAVTAVSGPSRLDCDTKTTTATLQAPPVQAIVPATRVRGSTEHVRTSEHVPATACI